MKLKKSMAQAIAAAAVIVSLTAVYAADAVSPANGAIGVMPWEKLTVDYAEPVNAEDKTVSVNDLPEFANTAVADGNMLVVDFKNIGYGKRYKTVIKNSTGETELVTFFNTGFLKAEKLLKFGNGNMDTLWNNRASKGASAVADKNKLEMTSTADGTVGGRINSTEFNVETSQNDVLILKAASQQNVDFNIYFSKNGGNKGFVCSCGTISLAGGGETQEYKIPLAANADWNGTVKQFLFEQETVLDNVITITSLEVEKISTEKTFIGDFDLYKDYGTEAEKLITGKSAAEGNITASLAGIQSETEKNVFLIIATYKDNVMTGAKCVMTDLSDNEIHNPSVSISAGSGETVKAFLRRDNNDIRIIKECITSTIE